MPVVESAPPITNFGGATVAQFESRLDEAMANLVSRHGGNPWRAPALSEVPITDDPSLPTILEKLAAEHYQLIVLMTGVGTRRLLDEAERAGHIDAALRALSNTCTVCRGPKPAFALKQRGIKSAFLVPEPHTTVQLLEYLATLQLRDRDVLVVSAGEQFAEPVNFLHANGGRPTELQLYRWDITDADAERLAQTVDELISGDIAVAAFTTQVQVRHLFNIANKLGKTEQLTDVLRSRVVVGAVGPTCATALRERGVEPDVIPVHPRMGHLITALGRAIAGTYAAREGPRTGG